MLIVPVGVGLTITVAVIALPVHPFAVGMIVKVTVIGAELVLTSTPVMFPLPKAPMPVTVPVLFLVQLNAVPATVPVSTIGVM
mgnify:FL=1|jgi:hypothetical protein